ncbi:MAG: hypothetical protein H5U08_02775 [Thermogutta sp.]|uniref:hypothetical protein n=1 Tax=Thermogutta sp. TaxID=1962930 RepID=UPI0019AF61A1|nr:hypothetical protein [Thermogutta sp.]MBC7351257.1 hypothetical protein [Thermogutta sp.]
MANHTNTRSFGKPVSALTAILVICAGLQALQAEEPPAINPFGPRVTEREDAIPGYIELSNGEIIVGKIYMTRDKRLKIYDSQLQRQREIPLNRVKQIECVVVSEKMEKEWRFKETTSDVKEYTGRTYPLREYVHRVTLTDGRTIEGPLSEVIYIQPDPGTAAKTGNYRPEIEPMRYILYKTHKGAVGQDLKSLVYVKAIRLGEEAYQEGMKKTGGKGVSGPRTRGR